MVQLDQVIDETDFPLDGGRVCLNFVATLGKRHARPVERIPDAAALGQWLVLAGLLPAELAGRPATAAQLRDAQALREVLNRLVRGTIAGAPLNTRDIGQLNDFAVKPDLAPQLQVGPNGVREGVRSSGHPVAGALATIARDAIALLASPRAQRIKECAHPDCSLLFLDDSQAGNRRWCSMERCGNLVKISGYRNRKRRTS
jgi:predicted RNA-binding Zn ribbon-like protein